MTAQSQLITQFSDAELRLMSALQKHGIVVALRREEANGQPQFACWGRYLDQRRDPAAAHGATKAEAIHGLAAALGVKLEGAAGGGESEG